MFTTVTFKVTDYTDSVTALIQTKAELLEFVTENFDGHGNPYFDAAFAKLSARVDQVSLAALVAIAASEFHLEVTDVTEEPPALPATRYAAEIAPLTEVTSRDFQTASWWSTYSLFAGTYDVVATTIDGRPVPAGEKPYYGTVAIPAIEMERYRESRFGAHVIPALTRPFTRTTYTLQAYWHEFVAGTAFRGREGFALQLVSHA